MKRAKTGLVALLVIAGIVAAVLYWQNRDTSDEETAAGDDPVLIARQATRRTLRKELTLRGTLERVEVATVNASLSGAMSALAIDDGETVDAGQPLFSINGRPSVAVMGDQQFFRELDVGSSGPDVEQLETILADAGFSPGQVDQLYTTSTRVALAGWQQQQGYPSISPEAGEVISLSLVGGSGYTAGPQNTATLTIDPELSSVPVPGTADDDSADGEGAAASDGEGAGAASAGPVSLLAAFQPTVITLLPPVGTVAEGDPIQYSIVSTTPAPAPNGYTINITYAGTAVAGGDYSPTASQVTIPPGATQAAFNVNTVDDTVIEVDPVLTVTIGPDGATTTAADIGSPDSGTTTIRDDDEPEINVTVAPTSVAEGGSATVTVTASSAPLVPLTVSIDGGVLAGTGTATAGTDYIALPLNVTIPAGSTSATFAIDTLADTLLEPDEDVVVTVQPGAGYDVGPSNSATLLIEGDGIPDIDIALTPTPVTEGTVVTATVTASVAPTSALTVALANPAGTADELDDYTGVPSSIVIPAGQTSMTFPITTVTDVEIETNETITLAIDTGIGYNPGPNSTATVDLLDNGLGQAPIITVTVNNTTVPEGQNVVYTVDASYPLPEATDVQLSYSGSAVPNVDYRPPTTTAVTLAAGAETGTVTVTTIGDNTVESDRTLTATLVPDADYVIGQPSTATVDIVDDDVPELTLSGGGTVSEGDAATVTLTSNQASPNDITVSFQTFGTATVNNDYEAAPSVVTLPAGQTSVSFQVRSLPDITIEPDEDVVVSFAPDQFYQTGNTTSVTVTIVDGNKATGPVLTITSSAETVIEGGAVVFTVGASSPSARGVNFALTLGGSGVNTVDYVFPPEDFVLPADQSSVTISVQTRQNTTVQGDRTIAVSLVGGAGYAVGTPGSASTTIEDDDVPELTLRGGSVALAEGGTAAFLITADQPVAQDTSVNYSVGGSATPGVDFDALTGTVIMLAGQSQVTIPVDTIDDDVRFLPTDMIVAEWPARVGSVFFDQGETVNAGSPLVEITEDEFTVTLVASPSDRSELAVGQAVQVEIEAGDQDSPGLISELDDTATVPDGGGAETYEGRVDVDAELLAVDGATATITVVLEEATDVVAVPAAAILTGGSSGSDQVRIVDVDSGELFFADVTTGLQEESWVEITEGLSGGELIIVEVQS